MEPKLRLPLTTGAADAGVLAEVEGGNTPMGGLVRQLSGGASGGLSMEWEHLSFAIKGKQILKDITGCVMPSHFTAVLGPSGSGKSTLLNILAGRQRTTGPQGSMPLTGTISVSGTPIDVADFKSNIAYVMQDDSLMATETPRECIGLSAQLRRAGTRDEHEALVNTMLSTLGLTKCQNTIVGSALLKGISGGERKRTSVGVELTTAPKMLFLDEPLSGLDSYAAFTLVKALKELAGEGVPVLCTVHQPSSEIFAMFDDVIILHDGEVVFHGPVDRLARYFNRWERCPDNFNPADHVMFLLQKDAEENSTRTLEMKQAWKNSELYSDMVSRQEGLKASSQTANLPQLSAMSQARLGCVRELTILTAREYRALIRNKGILGARFGMSIFLAGLYAWLFAGSARHGDDPDETKSCLADHYDAATCGADFQAHYGTLVSLAIAAMMGSAQPILLTFPNDRPVFLREYASQQYGVIPYFVSKTLMEMPVVLMAQVLTFIVAYWIMGLQGSWFGLVVISWGLGIASSSLALVIGCAVASAQKAIQLAPLALIPQMLFSGLFLPVNKIPQSLRWVKYLCPLKYAINLSTLVEFSYVHRHIEDCEATNTPLECLSQYPGDYQRQEMIKIQGVKWDDWSFDLAILVALAVGFRVVATLLLWRKGKYVF